MKLKAVKYWLWCIVILQWVSSVCGVQKQTGFFLPGRRKLHPKNGDCVRSVGKNLKFSRFVMEVNKNVNCWDAHPYITPNYKYMHTVSCISVMICSHLTAIGYTLLKVGPSRAALILLIPHSDVWGAQNNCHHSTIHEVHVMPLCFSLR